MSMTSITSGEVYNVCKNIAITAIKELGYGASGVDIAISKTEVSESLGAFVSGVGKISGKITRGKIEGNVYFLEANTMPSVSNPMILHDLVKSIKSNIK
jgi:D-alanine-D-alanine ligase-like ATP-grasp enzyme